MSSSFASECWHNRRTVVAGIAIAFVSSSLQGGVRSNPGTVPRVLFICQAGTVKSAVARELFRRRARERGVAVVAFSRGIAPADHVSPALKAHLDADGIDSKRDGLHKLERADVESADLVVAFDALPPDITVPRLLDWSTVPSLNEAYPAARADLARRIDALLDMLKVGK